MKCPVCEEEGMIHFVCSTELQGEAPMTGYITFVDDIEQDCDCTLSADQVEELMKNAVCDDDEEDGWNF